MFTEKINQVLSYDLDNSRVKSRQKGNITLSYLEGFDIIETANKVFGFGNWDYSTKLELVSQELNQNQNHSICYRALVSIVVHDVAHTRLVSREDVGFGTGIAKTLAEAHEGGAKEAVTDALKRCFRSFGNQFGNSLYDKSRQHQNQNNQQAHKLPQIQQTPNAQPQEYTNLANIGLSIIEKDQNLVVVGPDIFSKKDSIKACGFRWDAHNKLWYKPLESQAA